MSAGNLIAQSMHVYVVCLVGHIVTTLYVSHPQAQSQHQIRGVDPMLDYRWASVVDAGPNSKPALDQRL